MSETVEQFVKRLPTPVEIKARLSENIRENRLLKQILKLSEQRGKLEEARQR